MSDPPLPPNAALRWDRVSRLLPADARDVLEIGCGGGAVAVRLARRYRYVGVDIDESSVRATEKRLADAGLSGDVLLGDPTDALPDSADLRSHLRVRSARACGGRPGRASALVDAASPGRHVDRFRPGVAEPLFDLGRAWRALSAV